MTNDEARITKSRKREAAPPNHKERGFVRSMTTPTNPEEAGEGLLGRWDVNRPRKVGDMGAGACDRDDGDNPPVGEGGGGKLGGELFRLGDAVSVFDGDFWRWLCHGVKKPAGDTSGLGGGC